MLNPRLTEKERLYGARWNSPGIAAVYASETRALSVLEILVGIRSTRAIDAYVLIPIRFDDSIVDSVQSDQLPEDWRKSPPPPSTQRIGDDWVMRQRSAILRVPSAIIPAQFNYVINPVDAAFAQVQIGEHEEITIDPRLLR
jgi:RES domain-containing protein